MPRFATTADPTPLARKLAARIAATGPISFHDYMEACLHDPEFGYYRTRNPLGRDGDFVTAPEISQVFGELVGLWTGLVWQLMGEPCMLRLIELGPGRGTLMADALRALRIVKGFRDSASVHLVESAPILRDAQKQLLKSSPCPVAWHALLNQVPEGPAIIIANEFLDCLPVRQFIFDASTASWRERLVTFVDGALRFADMAEGPPVTPPSIAIGAAEIADGAIIECRPGTAEIIAELAERGRTAPCAALIIDYGYAKPSFGDTVQAVSEHRFENVFANPGETDLTAHVDFAQMRQQALERGLAAHGPMPMGEWLLRLGVEARLGRLLAAASKNEWEDLRSGVARLVDPAQMGALFKVMALTHGIPVAPPPF